MNADNAPSPADWPVREFRAMGSSMSVRVAATGRTADEALTHAAVRFAADERLFSRFNPDSELSHVNRQAGQWAEISPRMAAVVDTALALAAATGGLYDPTLLSAIRAAGYTVSFEQLSGRVTLPLDTPQTGRWADVRRRNSALFLPHGVGLDLGGIVKGWTAQAVTTQLGTVGPALVDAGGDVVAGDPPPGWQGWPVAVAAPSGADEADAGDLLVVWLANTALATSGVDYRRWRQGDAEVHHIIDPRTGRPAATDLVSVSVLDTSAARAEAWAKAALVLGWQAGDAALRTQKLAAVLAHEDGRVAVTPAMEPHIAWSAVPA